jgi:hypothetical protein
MILSDSNETVENLRKMNIEQKKLIAYIIKQLTTKNNNDVKLSMSKISYKPVFSEAEIDLNEIENCLDMQRTIEIDIIDDQHELLLSEIEESEISSEEDFK